MNYQATYMQDVFEKEKNKRATLITLGIAGAMVLLFIFYKWPLPKIEKLAEQEFIEVELNLPEEPMASIGGGGGGGNPVQASGSPGAAPSIPPNGDQQDARDIEADDNEPDAPAIVRPDKPKPTSNNVSSNPNPPKKETVVSTPAPPKPKATVGRTLTGGGTGGGSAEDYDRSGGSGTGNGVGTGSGSGGGNGTGVGGGNGSGSGTGTGPKRVSGNRVVINPKNMNAGENLRGKVLAEIKVSPDGIGTFVRARVGSTYSNGPAIQLIREWLRQNRFNRSDDESTVVYEFNFLIGG